MTGILDFLMNVKLNLEEGFQSTDDNYMSILNVSTPERFSFKMVIL